LNRTQIFADSSAHSPLPAVGEGQGGGAAGASARAVYRAGSLSAVPSLRLNGIPPTLVLPQKGEGNFPPTSARVAEMSAQQPKRARRSENSP
jgi:hypothetical protein